MRFWDSSALLPLIVQEPLTSKTRSMLADDREILVWALTGVELASAIWRRARTGEIDDVARVAVQDGLAELEQAWSSVTDVPRVALRARRLLASHPLRAADACQLAAALLACHERPDVLPFVTLDSRLAEAARREGFQVLPASDA